MFLKNTMIVLEVIASVALIITVLLQTGKDAGMGAISGNNESYMGKSNSRGLEKMMAKATKWVALIWLVLTLALSIL